MKAPAPAATTQGMKLVPAAAITTPEYNRSLQPRTARVAAFRMDPTEVTESQYAAFLADAGYFAPTYWGGRLGSRRTSSRPIAAVSLVDAMYYCAWRKVRLPTWEEWHLAAFGPDRPRKPWGDSPADDVLSLKEDLTPVGAHPKSAGPYQLPGILGNAWEWCGSPLQHIGQGGREFTDHRLAVVLGGGMLRPPVSVKKSDMSGPVVYIISNDRVGGLHVFWDEQEGLPNAGYNQTVWGAEVVTEDFLCISAGGNSVWMGTPEKETQSYPRLCVVAADFSLRSPSIGFRCAVTDVAAP